MLLHVFRLHGFPRDAVSDWGQQFWNTFCAIIGATVSLPSGYHPQSNGQTERLNLELEKCLRCLVSNCISSWSKNLIWVGRFQPPLFPELETKVAVLSAQALIHRCHWIWKKARYQLIKASAWQTGIGFQLPHIGTKNADVCSRSSSQSRVCLKLPRTWKIHPAFHVSCVTPVKESPLIAEWPLSWVVESGGSFEILVLVLTKAN